MVDWGRILSDIANGGLAIDSVRVFRAVGIFTLVLAAPLLIVPVAHAATGREPFKRRAGLWIAGSGFLSMGLGLIDVGSGRGNPIVVSKRSSSVDGAVRGSLPCQ